VEIHNAPIAKAQMLVRRPVAEVFEAFLKPAVTTRFWFSKSSGRLDVGKQIRWDWEMYDASTNVDVKAVESNRRILIEWDGYDSRKLGVCVGRGDHAAGRQDENSVTGRQRTHNARRQCADPR
jgi:uncharacterized protein YndB with AHSA1/START domain